MKLIGHVHDQNAYQETVGLLHSRGIPTFTKHSGAPVMWPTAFRVALYVALDKHYEDALALLSNPDHKVEEPVDVEKYKLQSQSQIISPKFLLTVFLVLLAVALFFVAAVSLSGVEWDMAPNNSFKPTPLRGAA